MIDATMGRTMGRVGQMDGIGVKVKALKDLTTDALMSETIGQGVLSREDQAVVRIEAVRDKTDTADKTVSISEARGWMSARIRNHQNAVPVRAGLIVCSFDRIQQAIWAVGATVEIRDLYRSL